MPYYLLMYAIMWFYTLISALAMTTTVLEKKKKATAYDKAMASLLWALLLAAALSLLA